MAGHAEVAHGSDRATKIMKYDGLPGDGKPIVQEFNQQREYPVMGKFVSTLGDGVDMNSPILSASMFGDSIQKPKFMAKITLIDTHNDDNF